jgi:hypothetical protein
MARLELTRVYDIDTPSTWDHELAWHYEFVATNLWVVRVDGGWRLHHAHRYPSHRVIERPWLQEHGLQNIFSPSFRELVALVREIDRDDPVPRTPYVIDGSPLRKTREGYASRDGRFRVQYHSAKIRGQNIWAVRCTDCDDVQLTFDLRTARHYCDNPCEGCGV